MPSPWQPGNTPPPEGVDLLVVWAIPGWCLHGAPGLARFDPDSGWWDCECHDFAATAPAWWMPVPPLPGPAAPPEGWRSDAPR